jgi:hypothetical protein
MSKIGDYVKADEVVCPECSKKLEYACCVTHAVIVHKIEDDGLGDDIEWRDLDVDDEWFECPDGHKIPRWLYGIDVDGRYVRFYSEEAYGEWDYESID